MDILIAILIYGSIKSIILALMALGFALVYGISRIPNFAHGALYIISGFIVWSFLSKLGLPYFLSIVLAIIAIGVIGAMIYQFILINIFIYNRPHIVGSSTTQGTSHYFKPKFLNHHTAKEANYCIFFINRKILNS